MSTQTKQAKALLTYIMAHRRCDQAEAERWADQYCGDWRNTPVPRAKRIQSVATDEKEWEE